MIGEPGDGPAIAGVDKPAYWDDAVVQLVERDRILRKLIPRFSDVHLLARRDPFETLVRAVVGQQISAMAADAVWSRVACASGQGVTPAAVAAIGADALRTLGLSQRKAEYVLDLAAHFGDERIRPCLWAAMDDESVIADLTAIRGIGRWTAEMFLIFNLRRPDVLPLDDIGLLKAISLHYFSGEPVSRFEAREVAQAWKPWSTVATWYLWRSLDPVPVEY